MKLVKQLMKNEERKQMQILKRNQENNLTFSQKVHYLKERLQYLNKLLKLLQKLLNLLNQVRRDTNTPYSMKKLILPSL